MIAAIARAMGHVANGFNVIPIPAGEKGPKMPGWQKSRISAHEAVIDAFSGYPDNANVGLVMGNGLIAIDVDVKAAKDGKPAVDGRQWLWYAAVVAGETLVHASANGGEHHLFRVPPGVKLKNGKPHKGVDIKSDGGQIVAPGSVFDGRPYTVKHDRPIADLPKALLDLLATPADPKQTVGGSASRVASRQCKAVARPIVDGPFDATTTAEGCCVLPPGADRSYVVVALRRELERLAGTPEGGRNDALNRAAFAIATFGNDRVNAEACTAALVAAASVAGLEGSEVRPTIKSGLAGGFKRRRETLLSSQTIEFPIMAKHGPLPCIENVRTLLHALGIHIWLNEFDHREYVEGFEAFSYISDPAVNALQIKGEIEGLRVQPKRFNDYISELARQNRRHPLGEYLSGLQHDGVARVGNWLTRYAGAADTPLTRAIGQAFLIAAVRRVRNPGCKFDTLLVLEGPEGTDKSTALRILAGDAHFTDGVNLGDEAKVIMEQTLGKWVVEISEMQGSSRGVEKIKAQLSRTTDEARLAYGRRATQIPRAFVMAATTNEGAATGGYLLSTTGNRRFWPVRIARFDIAALKCDRDQLWAEAVALERAGESITLPEAMWADAAVEQEARRVKDPVEQTLSDALEGLTGFVPTCEIFKLLGFTDVSKANALDKAINRTMARLGWKSVRLTKPAHLRTINAPLKVRGFTTGGDASVWLVAREGGFVAMVDPF